MKWRKDVQDRFEDMCASKKCGIPSMDQDSQN